MKLTMDHPGRASAVASVVLSVAVVGCSDSVVTPSNNPKNQPTQGTVTQSPPGVGIAYATEFTFTATGFSDPSGQPMYRYLWNLGEDYGPITGNWFATIKHTYKNPGTYDIWVTAETSVGAHVPGSLKGLRIVSLAGLWGIRDAAGKLLMDNTSITQSEAHLSGDDTRPNCRQTVTGSVSDPRRITLTYTRLANDCSGSSLPVSFTFAGEADDQVKAFTGTMTPGGSAKLVKCSQPSVCE